MTSAASMKPLTSATESEPTVSTSFKRIVLTGFMGAGKTSVGHALAEAIGWSFLDLDAHLEERTGSSIPDLFAAHPEAHFRHLESSALANALSRSECVLGLGGGTPEELTNRLLLEQTPGTLIVFLDAPFEVLFDRCMLQSFASPEHIRPLLASPAEAAARFRTRQPFYQRLARVTIATDSFNPEEVAQQILAQIKVLG